MKPDNQAELLSTMILIGINNKVAKGEDLGKAITSTSKEVLEDFLGKLSTQHKERLEHSKKAFREMSDRLHEALSEKDRIIDNLKSK